MMGNDRDGYLFHYHYVTSYVVVAFYCSLRRPSKCNALELELNGFLFFLISEYEVEYGTD